MISCMEQREVNIEAVDTKLEFGLTALNGEMPWLQKPLAEELHAQLDISVWRKSAIQNRDQTIERGNFTDLDFIGNHEEIALYVNEDTIVIGSLKPNQVMVTGDLLSCVGIGLHLQDHNGKELQGIAHLSRFDAETDQREVDPMDSFREHMVILQERGITIIELASAIPNDLGSIERQIREIARTANPNITFSRRPFIYPRGEESGLVITNRGGTFVKGKWHQRPEIFSADLIYTKANPWVWDKMIR